MAIANVELTNTFNEFRTTVNEALTQINNYTAGTGSIDVGGLVVNYLAVETSLQGASISANNLNLGRVVVAGASGQLTDDAGLTYDTGTNALTVGGTITASTFSGNVSGTTVTASSLTADRVALVGTSGVLTDDAGLTYNSSTNELTLDGPLTVTGTSTFANGTFGGTLNIGGDLIIAGNTSYTNVTSTVITDPLIYLASDNYSSDLVDIGFIGHFNNGSGNNHTGVIRHATDGKIYLFTEYEPEIGANNVVNVNDPSFVRAPIVAGNAELDVITANSLSLSSSLSVNVTGNLTGDVTGNLTGNVVSTDTTVTNLIFNDSDGSNSVRFTAPATVSSNVIFTLPDADGVANAVLTTDGSGNLTFAEVAAGGGGGGGVTTGKAIAMAIVFG